MPAKDPYGLHRPTIPVAYAVLLLDILRERGLPHEQARQDSGIAAERLQQAEARITPTQWTRLSLNAVRLSGDEGLGYEQGLRLRLSSHGFLGYAAMTAPTLRDAYALAAKYFRLRLRHYRLHLAVDGDRAVLELEAIHPIPVLRSLFFEILLVGLAQGLWTSPTEPDPAVELWFDWPEPAYHARYRERLPRVRFSRPANQLRFPAAWLDRRPLLADQIAHQQALVQVEREYSTVKQDEGDLVARVRAELMLTPSGYPDLATLSARLCVSSRTLSRKLGARQASYQALLDEARLRDSRALLEASDLELQDIAIRMGFENPANFTRAFRRWTGSTPSDYRAARAGRH